MAGKAVLSEQRKLAIKAAATEWYRKAEHKKVACQTIGIEHNMVWAWVKGIRSPSPITMKELYKETSNDAFRLTKAEKDGYMRMSRGRGEFPDDTNWPDLDPDVQSDEPTVAPEPTTPNRTSESEASKEAKPNGYKEAKLYIVELMEELRTEIETLANLPANDPTRERARKELVPLAMALFYNTTKLELQYPEAFRDILGDLEMATGILR